MSITDQMDIFSNSKPSTAQSAPHTAHLPGHSPPKLPTPPTNSMRHSRHGPLTMVSAAASGDHTCGTPRAVNHSGTSHPHSPWVMTADLRCDHHGTQCHCIGDLFVPSVLLRLPMVDTFEL